MADRRVQMRGSALKLVDILRDIKSTKSLLKDILDESNDFARYPITIHNVLAEIYNKNYVQGYHDKYVEMIQEEHWCEPPKSLLVYEVDDKEYDPYTTQGLTDIMSDVCGYRISMKDEDKLNTETDYFPSYPSLLRAALTQMEETGYTEGQTAAYNERHSTPPTINNPHFEWDDDSNTFTMWTDQSGVTLWYMVGNENNPKIIYTNPVTLSEDTTVYYYAAIGKYKSETLSEDCGFNMYSSAPSRAPIRPTMSFNGGATISINATNDTDAIYYTVGTPDGDKIRYEDSFDLPAATGTTVYAWTQNSDGWSECSQISVQTWQAGPTVTGGGSAWSGGIINGTPVIQYQCSMPEASFAPREQYEPYVWTLSCDTENAYIWWTVIEGTGLPNEDTPWYRYSIPITLDEDGTLYAYAECDGYSDSAIARYATYASTKPITTKPAEPTFDYRVYNISEGLYIIAQTNAGIMYCFGVPQDFNDDSCWISVDEFSSEVTHKIAVTPENDCVVYAKTFLLVDPTIQSDYVTYDYHSYFAQYEIPAPTFSRIGNTVTIQYTKLDDSIDGTYELYYTRDGSDPKNGTKWGFNENQFGIPITSAGTTIRAIVRLIENSADGSTHVHWSKQGMETFSPEQNAEAFKDQFFTVRGATEINLIDTAPNSSVQTNPENLMSWSYDLVNWNVVNTWSVTGLNPNVDIYIYSASGLGKWRTMHFGEEDTVTISGNILTLVNGLIFKEAINSNIQIELPTAWERTNQFKQLFKDATSLVDAANLYIPEFECLGGDFQEMFKGCTALKYGPSFRVENIGVNSCQSMFEGCTSLISVPDINIKTIAANGCLNMFYGCSSLLRGGNWEVSVMGKQGMKSCFEGCTSMLDISFYINAPLYDNDNSINSQNCMEAAFKDCTSLNTDNINIASTTLATNCCKEMFKNCTSLETSTSLNADKLVTSCYESMFEGCTSLVNIGNIAATTTWLISPQMQVRRCMYRMFAGCTSMTAAPTIHLLQLQENEKDIMYQMFDGCSKLSYIKIDFLTNPIKKSNSAAFPDTADWTYQWVRGVAPTGTFEMKEDAEWVEVGESAIPIGWNVVGAINAPGVITSIYIQNMEEIVIEASNNDEIYWSYGTSWNEGTYFLYDGPWVEDNSVQIYARTRTSRGTWGPVFESDYLVIQLPAIVFTQIGNYIMLSSEPAYEQMYYRTHRDELIGVDYHLYDKNNPIEIEQSDYIIAYGVTKNGTQSTTYIYSYNIVINPPLYKCENNIVTLTMPDGVLNITDDKDFDPYISYYSWIPGEAKGALHRYVEPFLITEDRSIEAYTNWYQSYRSHWEASEPASFIAKWNEEGYNYIINIPIFKQKNIDWDNIIYCTYGQSDYYAEQIPEGVHVYYKVNGGETQEWIFKSNYESTYGTQMVITEDTTITAWATDGVQTTDEYTYSFEYLQSTPGITVPAPTIELVKNTASGGFWWLYIYCDDPNAQCHYWDTINRKFKYCNSGEGQSMRLGNFEEITITAWATNGKYESEPTTATFRNEDYVAIYHPLSINYNGITGLTSFTQDSRNPANATIEFSINEQPTDNPVFNRNYNNGPFIVNEHKYIYARTVYNYTASDWIFKECDPEQYRPSFSRNENVVTVSFDGEGAYLEYSFDGKTYARTLNQSISFNIPEASVLYIWARCYSQGKYTYPVNDSFEFDPQYVVIDAPIITVTNYNNITITNNEPNNENYTLKYKINDGEWIPYTNSFVCTEAGDLYARNYYYDGRYAESSVELAKEDAPIYWEQSTYSFDVDDTPDITLSNVENLPVTYYSSDTSIATIDSYGNVTFVDFGSCTLTAIFNGNTDYYPKTVTCNLSLSSHYFNEYLTIVSEAENNMISWNIDVLDSGNTISISTDNGYTWENKTASRSGGTILAVVNRGDKILIKGNNETYAWNAGGGIATHCFTSTGNFNIEGNIMSMIYGDNFIGQTTLSVELTFESLFESCEYLINARNLILPATTLQTQCYENMFKDCISLTTAPKLPATTLARSCYSMMFRGCTALTTAPTLPATTLAQYCYNMMFASCTALTIAPTLPATTLAQYCYYMMFASCTALTTAPTLPATTLQTQCYRGMFQGCTLLNYIRCLATNITASYCTDNWVTNVAASGTFVKASDATWPTGVSGIPTGWTVQDAA